MESLFEIQKIILEQFDTANTYNRSFYDQITWDNHATGIVGPEALAKLPCFYYKRLNGELNLEMRCMSPQTIYSF